MLHSIKSAIIAISGLKYLKSDKTALSVTAGIYLGIFPVIGTTTILCQLAVLKWKLNPVLVHSINLVLSPVQVLLMYPMMKAGRILFFNDHRNIPEIYHIFSEGIKNHELSRYLAETILGGIFIWVILFFSTGYFLFRLIEKLIAQPE